MATTLDMNTPEPIRKAIHANEHKQEYHDRMQEQLIQNQLQRRPERDYGRIFREYNTPAQWYQATPVTRSIYFYDPNYQRHLQQQSKSPVNIRPIFPPFRAGNQSPLRAKLTANSSYNHQQKQTRPTRLRYVPTLPPILTHKQVKHE